MDTKQKALQKVLDNPMSAEAWQECGNACGWKDIDPPNYDIYYNREKHSYTTWVSACFHEINLTEGWEKAVEYLAEITK